VARSRSIIGNIPGTKCTDDARIRGHVPATFGRNRPHRHFGAARFGPEKVLFSKD
jgi:hypothetical protein